jgi:amidase
MKIFSRDNFISSFSPAHPAVYKVASGEVFEVETHDAYKEQIQDEATLRPMIDRTYINCATGPIEVEGAKAGDVLEVKILDIRLGRRGVMVTNPGMGFLGDRITEPNTKIVNVEGNTVHFAPGIDLPLRPMIGLIGVAPAAGEIPNSTPGDHGSNMDATVVTTGATLYLPVAVDGANLAVGDLHASMGDGELCGIAVEIEGAVRLQATVLKREEAPWLSHHPLVEDAEHVYVVAAGSDFSAAGKDAVGEAIRLLQEKRGLNFPDAYRLASAACDIQICQVVNPLVGVRVRIPKALLA